MTQSGRDARVLITGASGYLAHRLVQIAASSLQPGKITATSRTRPAWLKPTADRVGIDWIDADLLDVEQVKKLFEVAKPTAVINCAATNPGQAQNFDVNVTGAETLASIAAAHDVRLVHVSSDIVHAGTDPVYRDDAEPDPINPYGRSKAAGEAAVLRSGATAVVARASLIYGLEEMDRGTAGFAARLAAGEAFSLWADAIRHPVEIDSLSRALLALGLEHIAERGTINVAGRQAVSRADFARRLLTYWGIDPSGIDDGSAAQVSGQPLDLRLAFDRADGLGLNLPGVDAVLAEAVTV